MFPHWDPLPLLDIPSLVAEAAAVLVDITNTCTALFKPHHRPDPHGVWW